MRAHSINSTTTGTKTIPMKAKVERSNLRMKAAKKRRLIEFEETGNAAIDDDERFECSTNGKIVKTEFELRKEMKTEDDAIPTYDSQAGLQSSTELMQFNGAPEEVFKDEFGCSHKGFDGSKVVYGTPCLDHKHEMYGSISDQSQDTSCADSRLSDLRVLLQADTPYHNPKSINHGLQYLQPIRYSPSNEGCPESPIIVD
jgi:hypothetical protein